MLLESLQCSHRKVLHIMQGKNPYIIPVGGSSPLGTWGYLEAVREMEEQLQAQNITDVALVRCCPSAPAGKQSSGALILLLSTVSGVGCHINAVV